MLLLFMNGLNGQRMRHIQNCSFCLISFID
nr:MAG TPA: hypothetical protein [Caudoviricetes sp.]